MNTTERSTVSEAIAPAPSLQHVHVVTQVRDRICRAKSVCRTLISALAYHGLLQLSGKRLGMITVVRLDGSLSI